ncbi:helix-turn-helix domain-containing protein [Mycobacterium asiaticum]|uniref:helix-turn-helix domain-containing protein n=1 Tax=Mycobacterium asiaticum TaxID=1790 RepID=UPI0007EF76F5|nr:helix-turn-helix domain-containing protein [Mycobacterium asiaticum]OBJ63260.1 hypothetical protein A9W94_11065 [Mycobacterium asiaticum]
MTAAESESGLIRVGGFIVLSGPALRAARDCALIAVKHRKLSGLPYRPYEALAWELASAMAAAGHSDVRLPAVSHPVPMHPTLSLDEAAARLNISLRQARRRAPQLGGQKIAGRWFVDETALLEHIEGRQ